MTRQTRTRWKALLFVLPFSGILFVNARLYWPFISDDALISLRYAARLLGGHGLSWTDGHPVEGYSNLLWVLGVAALGALGIDLIAAARMLGVLSILAMMIALSAWYFAREPFRIAWLSVTVALLFLTLGAPIAVWAIGGLEQPLVGVLLALSVLLMFDILDAEGLERRRLLLLSLALGLLCLTRPDGALFAGAAVASLVVLGRPHTRARLRRAALVLMLPVLLSAGQLAFRLLYYGEWIPNTALVKITPSRAHWLFGWRYFTGGFTALAPFSYVAIGTLAVLIALKATRRRALYLFATAATWAGYLVFVGGDVFPAYRHFVPLMVLLAFALSEGSRLGARLLMGRPLPFYLATAGALLLFVPYTNNQLTDKQSLRAVRERWEWDCRDLGQLLKAAFARQQPLVAVTAAGCLPYWSELPSLDMLGLNDHYLPRNPPKDIGTGLIGHELGDGRYVLSRQPDLIVFNVGTEPHYRSGEELAVMSEFRRRYVPVPIEVPHLDYAPLVYINVYSGRVGIGITRSASAITIPGLLFTGPGAVATIESGGRLAVRPAPGERVSVSFDSEEALVDWTLEVRSSPSGSVIGELKQSGRVVSVSLRVQAGAPGTTIAEAVVRRGR